MPGAGLMSTANGKLLGMLKPSSNEYIGGTPAISDARVYIAGTSHLIAFGLK